MRCSQSDARIRSALYGIRISYPSRSPILKLKIFIKTFSFLQALPQYDYLKKLTWKESVGQLIKLSLINCIHIGLGIRPAASAQYDCPQPNTKANMNTVN